MSFNHCCARKSKIYHRINLNPTEGAHDAPPALLVGWEQERRTPPISHSLDAFGVCRPTLVFFVCMLQLSAKEKL